MNNMPKVTKDQYWWWLKTPEAILCEWETIQRNLGLKKERNKSNPTAFICYAKETNLGRWRIGHIIQLDVPLTECPVRIIAALNVTFKSDFITPLEFRQVDVHVNFFEDSRITSVANSMHYIGVSEDILLARDGVNANSIALPDALPAHLLKSCKRANCRKE